jgi:hypothetical protein
VGGFGSSKYLRDSLGQASFGGKQLRVIQPVNAYVIGRSMSSSFNWLHDFRQTATVRICFSSSESVISLNCRFAGSGRIVARFERLSGDWTQSTSTPRQQFWSGIYTRRRPGRASLLVSRQQAISRWGRYDVVRESG